MSTLTSLDPTLIGPINIFLAVVSMAGIIACSRFIRWLYKYGLPARYLRPLRRPW